MANNTEPKLTNKQNVKRRFKLALVIVIMTAAFIIPLSLSILRDSFILSDAILTDKMTYGGYAFIVYDAKEEYIPIISAVDGVVPESVVYIDGAIYAKVYNDVINDIGRTHAADISFSHALDEIEALNGEYLRSLTTLYALSYDSFWGADLLMITNIVFIIAAAFISLFAYRKLIGNSESNFGMFSIFFVSAFSATFFSIISMYSLLTLARLSKINLFSWIVFSINPLHMLLNILALLLLFSLIVTYPRLKI